MSIIIKDLGAVTAYAYAVEQGYEGTEEEFAELMASYAEVAIEAEASAQSAALSAETATAQAQSASDSADEASASAATAGTKADEASQSATLASSKASDAATNANTATTKAGEAASSAASASQSASSAASDAATITALISTAEGYADRAEAAVTAAEGFAEDASDSATSAESSATSASGSASTATQKATAASGSASTAMDSALKSEGFAVGKQNGSDVGSDSPYYHNNAKYYAEQASGSATSASGSATTASTKASEASTSATNASASATSASESATEASGYASSAQESAESAEASAHTVSEAVERLEEIDHKAPVIISTASGSIASFADGADDMACRSVVCQIEPVQDLHGQDAPYPAGGGKNLLPMTLSNIKTINTAGTWSGNAYTLYGVTYTVNVDDGDNVLSVKVNGTASQYSLFRLCNKVTFTADVKLSGSPATSYNSYKLQADTTGQPYQEVGSGVSIPANTAITRIIISVPNASAPSDAVFYPKVYLATETSTDFAPYSNICPITGWDGVTVTRCGKNLLNTTLETTTRNGITVTRNSDGTFRATGTATATADFYLNYHVGLEAGVSYTLSGCPSGGSSTKYKLDLYMASGTQTDYGNGVTFTGSKIEAIARIIVYPNAGAVDLLFEPMLRIASVSDATYEPYTADSHSLSFPQTVYGGWVDVIKGELHVTHIMSSATVSADTGWTGGTTSKAKYILNFFPDFMKGKTYGENNRYYISNCSPLYKYANNDTSHWYVTSDSSKDIRLVIPLDQTGEFVFQAVAELVTEQVIPLDPVTIKTLLGNNNIYADTGDTTAQYPADTKLYIDGKFVQLQALILES